MVLPLSVLEVQIADHSSVPPDRLRLSGPTTVTTATPKRVAEGRYKGRKPYRTREGEQAIIERMRELRQAGLGFGRIAAALNREGAETSSG
jgi:hypothetical protein